MCACDCAIVCSSRADIGQPSVLLSGEVDLDSLNILGAFLVLAASVFYAAASIGDSKLVIRSSFTTNSVIPKRVSLRRGHDFSLSHIVRRCQTQVQFCNATQEQPGTNLQSCIQLSWKFSISWQLQKNNPDHGWFKNDWFRSIEYFSENISASLQTSMALTRLPSMALEVIHCVSFWIFRCICLVFFVLLDCYKQCSKPPCVCHRIPKKHVLAFWVWCCHICNMLPRERPDHLPLLLYAKFHPEQFAPSKKIVWLIQQALRILLLEDRRVQYAKSDSKWTLFMWCFWLVASTMIIVKDVLDYTVRLRIYLLHLLIDIFIAACPDLRIFLA